MKYRNDIWLANLDPQFGTETGKTRPVVIIQSDVLNEAEHFSTMICPITTNLQNATILRVRLNSADNGINKDSDILIDQIRTIDISRFIKKIGTLTPIQIQQMNRNLKILTGISDL